ncbi:alpha/beta hydrolase [Agrobacterium vitis]
MTASLLRPVAPIIVETGQVPNATILFIHGLGTDGNTFLPVIQRLNLGRVGPVRFVLPNAPKQPVSICQGQTMSAWFDLLDQDFVAREDEAGLRTAVEYFKALIEAEIKSGIAPERIVIAGFSQGGALSLLTGLRFRHRLAGIAALSGWLPLSASLGDEHSQASLATPVFLGHGAIDKVTPLRQIKTAQTRMEALGYTITSHTYPIGHTITEAELHDLSVWLEHCLG